MRLSDGKLAFQIVNAHVTKNRGLCRREGVAPGGEDFREGVYSLAHTLGVHPIRLHTMLAAMMLGGLKGESQLAQIPQLVRYEICLALVDYKISRHRTKQIAGIIKSMHAVLEEYGVELAEVERLVISRMNIILRAELAHKQLGRHLAAN